MMHNAILGHIRGTAERSYLRATCTIEEEQTIKDADFLNSTSWQIVATVNCRLLPAGQGDSERVEEFASQESIRVIKRLVTPHGTALNVGQRATVGSEIYHIASLDIENTDKVFQIAVVVQMAGADDDG